MSRYNQEKPADHFLAAYTFDPIMPKKIAALVPPPLDHYFSKELAGENPPSFLALRTLYDRASLLLAQEPWHLLAEQQLVLLRSGVDNELCYCSVMGRFGQVYAMHAYLGPEGLRMFRKIQAGEVKGPSDFYAAQRSVYVDFVPRSELEKPDRELLAALGHPQRARTSPMFRAVRPGFYPWFVTAEEAKVLQDCISAVSAICSALASGSVAEFWDLDQEVHPLMTQVSPGNSDYRVERVKVLSTPSSPALQVRVEAETLRQLQESKRTVHGVMELDHKFCRGALGTKYERKAITCVALVVDADTGIIYASEIDTPGTPPADAIAQAFLKAVRTTGVFPREVRVRNEGFKDALLPLMQSIHVAIRVHRKLPALDDAYSALNAYLS